MIINHQIRDEKLQRDINREAVKISALSSGKVHKYEYLTGEDWLPFNQQQTIEQAKFTYFPLGKAFEKQIKTIQDQGKVKTIEEYTYDAEDIPMIPMQKQIFNELVDERVEEITNLDKKVKSNDLIDKYKCNTADAKFYECDNALGIINKVQNGEISLTDVKNN